MRTGASLVPHDPVLASAGGYELVDPSAVEQEPTRRRRRSRIIHCRRRRPRPLTNRAPRVSLENKVKHAVGETW